MIYVRLTSSSGNWDAEFLLLEVLRTHADEPWTAAFDPKRTNLAEPYLAANRPKTVARRTATNQISKDFGRG